MKRYNSLDGLRALSCISIIAMHVLYNTEYNVSGFIYDKFIPSLTWLVYLFLIISGFGISAGYLNKFISGEVDLENFYFRRYSKILPFFSFLVLIAFIVEPSLNNLYEAGIELTLLFGLLPNNTLNLLGVSWTLGVIFLFYFLYPAISVLLRNKKRAILSLLCSLVIMIFCNNYFFSNYFVASSFTPRHSFIFCLPLFLSGSVIYLFRENIETISVYNGALLLGFNIALSVVYYVNPIKNQNFQYILLLLIFIGWVSYAIYSADNIFLSNKIMKYLGAISFEMYLAHMIMFRVLQKAGLIYLFGYNAFSYFFTLIVIVLMLIVFINCYRFLERKLIKSLRKGH